MPKARWCSSRARCPASTSRSQVLQKKPQVRRRRAPPRSCTRRPAARAPRCPHFGVCGGCATQHADARTQMAAKQRWLEDNLARIGKVKPETLLPIVYGQEWGYRAPRAPVGARTWRRRAARWSASASGARPTSPTCANATVLPPRIARLIPPLATLVESALDPRARCRRSRSRSATTPTVLVFRHLAAAHRRGSGPAAGIRATRTVSMSGCSPPARTARSRSIPPQGAALLRRCRSSACASHFRPTDFTQVNHGVNRMLVSRAVRLLDPQPGERIADLFCGLGNFSLPLATRGAQVIGFEGSRELVERARAQRRAPTAWWRSSRSPTCSRPASRRSARSTSCCIDPPREGAMEIVKALPGDWPRRIVYVSCDPATLARDAGVLVHTQGFRLVAAGRGEHVPAHRARGEHYTSSTGRREHEENAADAAVHRIAGSWLRRRSTSSPRSRIPPSRKWC